MHKQPQYGAKGVKFSLFINAVGYNTRKFWDLLIALESICIW